MAKEQPLHLRSGFSRKRAHAHRWGPARTRKLIRPSLHKRDKFGEAVDAIVEGMDAMEATNFVV